MTMPSTSLPVRPRKTRKAEKPVLQTKVYVLDEMGFPVYTGTIPDKAQRVDISKILRDYPA